MKLSFTNVLSVLLLVTTGASAIPSPSVNHDARIHRRHRSHSLKNRASIAPRDSRSGIISAWGSKCGDPKGSSNPSPTGGPNGAESWLDCGVDTPSGWSPPPITLDNLIYKDLSTVLNQPNNPFNACKPYLWMFQQLSGETGIPTILLASIALQESGCNPGVTGGAGEIGMMQVTKEKCPNGDIGKCYDAYTNIGIGARYLKTVIGWNNGNIAAAMGGYNGWWAGMTVHDANNYPECARHNNLDYLQNVFNGYLQGVDPYSMNMGMYHNTC